MLPLTRSVRVPSGVVVWALLATVLGLALASTAVLYLNNRAGQTANSAGTNADSYRKLEVAILQTEIARHDLLLEGGTTEGVLSALRLVNRRWLAIEDAERAKHTQDAAHEEGVHRLGEGLTRYERTVMQIIQDLNVGASPDYSESATDLAATLLVEHVGEETAEHDADAAHAFDQLRGLQESAARVFPVAGALGVLLVGACMRILTRQRRRLASLREDAHARSLTDELTGLANRAGLRATLEHALGDGSSDPKLALLLLDLDGFKAVNDTYGHEMGDEVLKDVAARLLRAAPARALVARLGGDEFVVLVPDADRVRAHDVAQMLYTTLAEPTVIRGVASDVRASIGVALTDGAMGTSEERASDLLRRADIAMYGSKKAGTGPVLWSGTLDQFVARVPQRQPAARE